MSKKTGTNDVTLESPESGRKRLLARALIVPKRARWQDGVKKRFKLTNQCEQCNCNASERSPYSPSTFAREGLVWRISLVLQMQNGPNAAGCGGGDKKALLTRDVRILGGGGGHIEQMNNPHRSRLPRGSQTEGGKVWQLGGP